MNILLELKTILSIKELQYYFIIFISVLTR